MENELNPAQLLLIGLVASLFVQAIKIVAVLVAKYFNKELKISKLWASVIAVAVSIALALLWHPLSLPPFDDPMAYLNALLLEIGVVSGWATVIYNVVLAKLLDGLGLSETKFALQT